MTHFNHDWDTTKTPAVPVSVGDRYYAQDLNDDFNYLKHLPYEVFLQGRSCGVMITPSDTWDLDTNSLTLSGGFGVISQDCIELDPNEGFTIPPKTHSSPRYERVSFTNATLILPPDKEKVYYIVATPMKRSLLQRTKTLFTEQYASRVRYDGIITIQETAPTAGQILVGLCCHKQYCLLIDNNPDQGVNDIIRINKWFGQYKNNTQIIQYLSSYYHTNIRHTLITGFFKIGDNYSGVGYEGIQDTNIINGKIDRSKITSGTFHNCKFYYEITIIKGGTFNNCVIERASINGGTFNDCVIERASIDGGTFNDCVIYLGPYVDPLTSGSFTNCIIYFQYEISNGDFTNCLIQEIADVTRSSIKQGNFYGCRIKTVSSATKISNTSRINLNLCHIESPATANLSSTSGKINILNDAPFHMS